MIEDDRMVNREWEKYRDQYLRRFVASKGTIENHKRTWFAAATFVTRILGSDADEPEEKIFQRLSWLMLETTTYIDSIPKRDT